MLLRLTMAMVVLLVAGCGQDESRKAAWKKRIEERIRTDEAWKDILEWIRRADANDAIRATLPENVRPSALFVETRVENTFDLCARALQLIAAKANVEVLESFRIGATEADWTDERIWRLVRKTLIARIKKLDTHGADVVAGAENAKRATTHWAVAMDAADGLPGG